ncbi:MAG: TRAP transporter TatT component family protein [Treponema sp.]|jgi:predicted anti-sigma-YlaC factor YlaD|nr:TRAP transporter TatT component family protein [Treponema sp.]
MKVRILCVSTLACFLAAGCSVNKLAVNMISNALTGEGSADVFTGDSDPELVGDALPFAIKMYESLLSGNPGHQGLILTTGSLFVMYSNAFVQGPAEMLPRDKHAERQAAMERAKKLYLRGTDILYGGLERKYPGFIGASQRGDLPAILAKMKKADVPYLYWSAAGCLSAYSLNPFDMDLGVRIPEFINLANRAYELDPDFGGGSLDDFFVLLYASIPEAMGGSKQKAEIHYRRALEKSKGLLAGPYVSYAAAVSIPAQDYDTFKSNIDAALAVDPDADPANRLVNVISQRKARYLRDSAALFFIDFDTGEDWEDEDF